VFQIVVSRSAKRDLLQIVDYIRRDNPSAAERFAAAILNHVEMLARFPRMGEPVEKRPGVRKLLHTPVRIYYRIDEEQNRVEILHFWHAARREASH